MKMPQIVCNFLGHFNALELLIHVLHFEKERV